MLHTDIPHDLPNPDIHLGIAGWNLRREHVGRFESSGTHLQRYASRFNAVEINSCFYRPHRLATYERWGDSVPEDFRFAVKLPKVITHELRFIDCGPALERFLTETSGLGQKRGPILVQLPPSFAYDAKLADGFFSDLRARYDGPVVFEPRHETWFTDEVELVLTGFRIARVAADPPKVAAAESPGGYDRVVYYRLHGSPRIYYSAYPPDYLVRIAREVAETAAQGITTWIIFDNTALGAATSDALTVQSHLSGIERAVR
ncbi:MAG: DUF72 domain-containing protein [Gemmatimonadaceae bacterium]